MAQHLHREIARLKGTLLQLSAIVEGNVQSAVEAVRTRSAQLAHEVSEGDELVDRMEIELEEDCLKVLALYQPVANDLRFIVATLKINNDLERIGDLAVHVAHRAQELATQTEGQRLDIPFDLEGMADKVLAMLRKSITALVEFDARAAREVCISDDEIDAMNALSFRTMSEELVKGRREALTLLFVSRHLERIADHTTNIAEDIIYMIEGEIVRHKKMALPVADSTPTLKRVPK